MYCSFGFHKSPKTQKRTEKNVAFFKRTERSERKRTRCPTIFGPKCGSESGRNKRFGGREWSQSGRGFWLKWQWRLLGIWQPWCCESLLTLWRRKTKSSPIFVKILQPITHGTLSSELFEFLRYLYPFQRYVIFSFSVFFNSARLFDNLFSWKLQCLQYFLCWFQIRWIVKISLTVQKIWMKAFNFF